MRKTGLAALVILFCLKDHLYGQQSRKQSRTTTITATTTLASHKHNDKRTHDHDSKDSDDNTNTIKHINNPTRKHDNKMGSKPPTDEDNCNNNDDNKSDNNYHHHHHHNRTRLESRSVQLPHPGRLNRHRAVGVGQLRAALVPEPVPCALQVLVRRGGPKLLRGRAFPCGSCVRVFGRFWCVDWVRTYVCEFANVDGACRLVIRVWTYLRELVRERCVRYSSCGSQSSNPAKKLLQYP